MFVAFLKIENPNKTRLLRVNPCICNTKISAVFILNGRNKL